MYYYFALPVLNPVFPCQRPDLDFAGIRDALAATKDFQGVSGTISMGKDRNPIKSITILGLVDGKQVLKEKMAPK